MDRALKDGQMADRQQADKILKTAVGVVGNGDGGQATGRAERIEELIRNGVEI